VIAQHGAGVWRHHVFFPVDNETLHYLRITGRSQEVVERAEWFTKEQGLFRTAQSADPQFSEVIELNLEDVEASLAGPKRPQDRVSLGEVKTNFQRVLKAPLSAGGYGLNDADLAQKRDCGHQWGRT